MRLEMHMLHAGGRVGLLVHRVGFLEALGDVADFALQCAEDVVAGGHDPCRAAAAPGLHA